MKPAPFEKTQYATTNKTPYLIKSDPDTNETTILHIKNKKVMWTMKEFTGRKATYVSPDGKILIVYGNLYFGGIINENPEEKVVIVYVSGTKTNEYTYFDISGETVKSVIAKEKLSVMGGGWVGLNEFIKKFEVNFDKKIMTFTLHNSTVKTITF